MVYNEDRYKKDEERFGDFDKKPDEREATAVGTNRADPVGYLVDALDKSRKAAGVVDGYHVEMVLGKDVEKDDGSWNVMVTVVTTDVLPSDGNVGASVEKVFEYDNKEEALMMFKDLLHMYDLDEYEFGFFHDDR